VAGNIIRGQVSDSIGERAAVFSGHPSPVGSGYSLEGVVALTYGVVSDQTLWNAIVPPDLTSEEAWGFEREPDTLARRGVVRASFNETADGN
jgi:hypothetical protein